MYHTLDWRVLFNVIETGILMTAEKIAHVFALRAVHLHLKLVLSILCPPIGVEWQQSQQRCIAPKT